LRDFLFVKAVRKEQVALLVELFELTGRQLHGVSIMLLSGRRMVSANLSLGPI
jgi:hypothetical protein